MGISNLKWHKAMGEAGTFFSHEERNKNLPTTLTPEQLAALQYPHIKGDISQAGKVATAFKNWVENACLTGDLPHITTIKDRPLGDVGYQEYLRRNSCNEFDKVTVRHIKASDFSVLLASEGEEPSVHLAVWIKAIGSESAALLAEAADASGGVEANKAGPATLKAEAVPDTPPVVAVGASGGVETDKVEPVWSLKTSIERSPGYRWPTYQALKDAKIAGQPCPKAQHLLDKWKLTPPNGLKVIQLPRRDELEYELETGAKKYATVKQIQAVIKGLLSE